MGLDLRAMPQEPPSRVERRLSAILAADVAGYSRLMHSDEEATHSKLTTLVADAVNPAIAEHGGRIVKNTGDGFLAEFPSAVEAVRAAMLFQSRIHELTIGDAEDRRLRFRVGINIGDVIVEPHDIFGDDVNIAARLESIAEPGGICISSSAYDHVRGKVGVEFADLDGQSLKNIARPVRAYKVVRDGAGHLTPLSALPCAIGIKMLCYGSLSVHVPQTHEGDRAPLSRKPVSVFLAEPEANGIQLGLARVAAGVEAQDFLALFFADAEAIAAEVACHDASIRSR
jgi:class 3 adenylate cyclase